MSNIQGIDLVQLRQNVTSSFSPGELEILCFDLNIPAGELPGPEHPNKVVQLISYCQRHGLFLNLIAYLNKARPHIQWQQEIQPQLSSIATVDARSEHRQQLYKQAHGIQLVHTILPSKQYTNDYWDILIYLVRHKSDDLSIVDYAEFFLGHYWENNIFNVPNSESFIGIAISAYGPVLCTCRVVFTNGEEVMLSRYIDLEMSALLSDMQGKNISPPPSHVIWLDNLRNNIDKNFNLEEVFSLCLNLNVNPENLQGDKKEEKIADLIGKLEKVGQLPQLVGLCRQERPYIQWR